RDGRFVYQRGYGYANLDYDIPNSPQRVYYIGSDSKQFTAAAVALLALQGRIRLDDDIRKYFPELPDYGTPITVQQLIYHTSGIRDMYVLMSLAGLRLEDVFTDADAMKLLARQKELNFKPGTDWNYSNSGYWLLGQLVKRVTGKSLRDYADSAIFQPLGMTRTHFHDDPGHVMKDRAMSYEQEGKGGFRISYLQNFDKIGAGGLYSTIDDLAKWDANFYSHRVGGDTLQKLIHTRAVLAGGRIREPGAAFATHSAGGDTLTYAFGNEVSSYRGLRTTEHGGAMMGYKAHILRFPDQRFTVMETCNLGSIDPGKLAHQVADVYLGAQMQPAKAAPARQRAASPSADWSPSAEELAAFAGDYYSDELDVTYHIAASAAGLAVSLRNTTDIALRPSTRDAFTDPAQGLELHFQRDAAGRPAGFMVEAGRVQHIRFLRR
ncbi:MAG TPA: serine hydrolase domain-containing protein, partial [Longimicrobiales bacterium]